MTMYQLRETKRAIGEIAKVFAVFGLNRTAARELAQERVEAMLADVMQTPIVNLPD
jgi:hypothetical protein